MSPRIAFMYKLATRLPSQYNIVPSSIRSRLLRMRDLDSNLSHHLANETARKILVEAFDLLGFHLERKNPPSLLITHDVETETGLKRTLSLKAVEDELGIQSTWFLPSDEYEIPVPIARELGDGSVIGSHDIKHDGRLVHIHTYDELVERLRKSRLTLEGIFEKHIRSFRSPLLQFSRKIVTGLGEAGYEFDFSLPTWEPIHPATMSGFGVESVHAFQIEGIVEIPLTLFQDHQVLNVLGMNTREASKFWVEQGKLIRLFDGDIVLLIHPDYYFSRDLRTYKELLRSLSEVLMLDCH
jgi:peptidoglycan/xylan/chitin deacetylase (PgdA/CDA1 family)